VFTHQYHVLKRKYIISTNNTGSVGRCVRRFKITLCFLVIYKKLPPPSELPVQFYFFTYPRPVLASLSVRTLPPMCSSARIRARRTRILPEFVIAARAGRGRKRSWCSGRGHPTGLVAQEEVIQVQRGSAREEAVRRELGRSWMRSTGELRR
jgi:hypothetical protein